MERLRYAGKIRHWGMSNHSSDEVDRCISAAQERSEPGPSVLEEYYSVAGYALNKDGDSRIRILEHEMFPLIKKNNLGLMAFSPMDAGQLAAAYSPEPRSALAHLTMTLDGIAKRLGITRSILCTAWSIAHPSVTSVLGGPENETHLDEMLAGTMFDLQEDVLEDLNNASRIYSDAIVLKGRDQQ